MACFDLLAMSFLGDTQELTGQVSPCLVLT